MLDFRLKQGRHGNAECVRYFHERSNRGIPIAQLQISQIAALYGRALGELFLGPALRVPERFNPLGQVPQDFGLRNSQPSMVPEPTGDGSGEVRALLGPPARALFPLRGQLMPLLNQAALATRARSPDNHR